MRHLLTVLIILCLGVTTVYAKDIVVKSTTGNVYATTPNESSTLPYVPRVGYKGDASDTVTRLHNNSATTSLVGVPGGVIFPIKSEKIYATGTTASDMLKLY
jgi:hypothetical protein